MHCPACERKLRRIKAGAVTLDACHGGCGGIWFDHRELEKVNAEHPNAGDKVANVNRDSAAQVTDNACRPCPRCKNTTLEQKLYSLGSGVIMDRCPKCQGLWLDHGELEKIRETIHTRARQPRLVTRTPSKKKPQNAIDTAIIQQVQAFHRGPQPRI